MNGTPAENRLLQWAEPKRLGFSMTSGDTAASKRIAALHEELITGRKEDVDFSLTTNSLISMCKEIIFDIKDGNYIFHAIAFNLNGSYLELEICHLFDIYPTSSEGATDEEEAVDILAIAALEDVPVYPNTAEVVGALADLHRKLIVDGFTAPNESGDRVRLQFAKRPTTELLDINRIMDLKLSTPIFAAEVEIIRRVAIEEISKLSRAEAVLSKIDIAVSELSKEISSKNRNENAIQLCITKHPILLGLDYEKIIPKHKLGAEYEMDYAAEKYSRTYDLIEIESSVLQIYTKAGNPSSHLVHAEQQVLDWLSWVEAHNSYAAKGLPEISSPKGIVIIGRSSDLTESDTLKLRHRNAMWGGKIQIFTYDQILERAVGVRERLISER